MLVKYFGQPPRESQYAIEQGESNPPAWQFKQFEDVANYGVEFIWPHEDRAMPPYGDLKSTHFFSVKLDSKVISKVNHSLLIIPHYSYYISSARPLPVTQMIETDWWPNDLELLFHVQPCIFKKGEPFAQGVIVPRKEYKVKEVDSKETKKLAAASKYLEQFKDSHVTRITSFDGNEYDNLYEVLSHLYKQDKLPEEIKPKKKPVVQLKWNQ